MYKNIYYWQRTIYNHKKISWLFFLLKFFFSIPEDFQVWSEENELFILEQLSQNCLFKFWSKKRNLPVFYLLFTATTALWYEQSEESQVFTPCFKEMEACYWPMASGSGSIVVQIKNLWSNRSSLPPFLPSQIQIGHWDRRTSLPLQPLSLPYFGPYHFYFSCHFCGLSTFNLAPLEAILTHTVHHSNCLKSKSDHATEHMTCSWLIKLICISGPTNGGRPSDLAHFTSPNLSQPTLDGKHLSRKSNKYKSQSSNLALVSLPCVRK